jgi:hypothetical protein
VRCIEQGRERRGGEETVGTRNRKETHLVDGEGREQEGERRRDGLVDVSHTRDARAEISGGHDFIVIRHCLCLAPCSLRTTRLSD